MEAKYSHYDFTKSIDRIDGILNTPAGNYTEHKGIPSSTSLTFENGFYVDVTVLFVDIRSSKELSEKHNKPVLAKIYRAYISEVIAAIKGNSTIHELYVEGDGVWAVFNTTKTTEVNSVFETAFTIASVIDIINLKLQKKGYEEIEIGIGIHDGEALCIKAGYNGSGNNEIVWIGKVVGKTAQYCSFGNKGLFDREIMVSSLVYSSLSEHNKALLVWNSSRDCYHGNVVRTDMREWLTDNA